MDAVRATEFLSLPGRLVGEETSNSPHIKGLFTLFWFFSHVKKGAKQATGDGKGSQLLGIALISRTQTSLESDRNSDVCASVSPSVAKLCCPPKQAGTTLINQPASRT